VVFFEVMVRAFWGDVVFGVEFFTSGEFQSEECFLRLEAVEGVFDVEFFTSCFSK
jgi:hypothetical protein